MRSLLVLKDSVVYNGTVYTVDNMAEHTAGYTLQECKQAKLDLGDLPDEMSTSIAKYLLPKLTNRRCVVLGIKKVGDKWRWLDGMFFWGGIVLDDTAND